MKITQELSILSMLLFAAGGVAAQETRFYTGFEYDFPPIVFEPADLNGAMDQVGEWSGELFPEGQGDILILPDSVGFAPSPYGGELLVLDRPTGPDGNDLTGSFFANLSEPVSLVGAAVSFQVGTRRTGGNQEKAYDVVGRDANGVESFRVRVGANNNGEERLGVVTDGGNTVTFDLPTSVGDDRVDDLNNTGAFTVDAGPGLGVSFANVVLRLNADGYVIDFSYPEENTSSNKNAYITESISYNGTATELAQLEFTYEASTNDNFNSGYILDEILVTGFGELLQGDFDGNGLIDMEDFLILAANFNTGTTHEQGDFNFDTQVNLLDFAGLKQAFQAPDGAVAAVPEPTGLLSSILGAAALLFCRRRRVAGAAVPTVACCLLGFGWDSAEAVDLAARMVRLDPSGGNGQINDTQEALGILRGTVTDTLFAEDVTVAAPRIDFSGNAGSFDDSLPYPNGVADSSLDDFLINVTGIIEIPAGDWTIGFGSDDGGYLRIPGVEFSGKYNQNGVSASDEIIFNGTRGLGWTMGEFTLAAPLKTQIQAVMFERSGGDGFEVAIIDVLQGSNDVAGFEVLSDGALGWKVVASLPGDFNFDEAVNMDDFLILANNFGTGDEFSEGDLDFSGRTDLADFVAFRDIFKGAAGAAAVPEPAPLSMLGMAVLLLPWRRRT